MCVTLTFSSSISPKDSQFISFSGRWLVVDEQAKTAAPGAGFQVSFKGSSIEVELEGEARWYVEIDGIKSSLYTHKKEKHLLTKNLDSNTHTLRLFKKTESLDYFVALHSISTSHDGHFIKWTSKSPRRIEFIGDSFTVGYGNEALSPTDGDVFSKTNTTKSYAFLLGESLKADIQINAYSGRGLVQNYANHDPDWNIRSLYMHTLPSQALLKLHSPSWDFNSWHPQVIVIFVGINDFQGDFNHTPDSTFDDAYIELLDFLRQQHPGVQFLVLSTRVYPQDLLTPRVQNVLKMQKAKGFKDLTHMVLQTENTALDGHPNLFSHQNIANQIRPTLARLGKWLSR